MPNKVYWELAALTAVEYFPGIADAATDLKNKLTDDAALGAAIDNTNAYQYIRFRLRVRLQAGATSGYVNLWLIRGMDLGAGIVYEDGAGGTSPTIPARAPDCIIPVTNTIVTQQVIDGGPILAPPEDFMILLENKTGQSFTNTDNENELWYQLFSDEIQ